MENEITELKEEIELLSKRIEILEVKENRRKAFSYAKILVRIALILFTIYGAWEGYKYLVNEMPKIMEEKIKEISGNSTLVNGNFN